MLGRMYTVLVSASVSAIQDLLELKSASGRGIRLHAVHIGQSSDTDSEQLRVQIKRAGGTYTSGSVGTTPTPQKTNPGLPAANFTAEANNTTQAAAGTGTLDTVHEDGFNVLNGWQYQPTPGCMFEAFNGDALIVSLPAAPIDALTMQVTAVVEELG